MYLWIHIEKKIAMNKMSLDFVSVIGMKVYHASSMVVSSPDTLHSRLYLDFGPGFYVTTI